MRRGYRGGDKLNKYPFSVDYFELRTMSKMKPLRAKEDN